MSVWTPQEQQPRRVQRWARLVPKEVSIKQVRWERAHRVATAHDDGISYREIARHLGLSATQVNVLCWRGETTSPVEKFLAAKHARFASRAQSRRFFEVVLHLADKLNPERPALSGNRDWLVP